MKSLEFLDEFPRITARNGSPNTFKANTKGLAQTGLFRRYDFFR
jgi:hypothetical protein